MDQILTIIGDLIITVLFYLLIPVIFILRKKKYSKRKILSIIIINGLCIWLIFRIISGGPGGAAPTYIWSSVAYLLMKKKCLKEDTTNEDEEIEIIEEEVPEVIEIKEEKKEKIKEKKKHSKKKSVGAIITICILSFLLILSLCLNFYQFDKVKTLEEEPKNYVVEYKDDKYESYYNRNHEKLDFYDEHIVFVIDGYGDYYFTYEQMNHVTSDDEEFEFWAYNEEAAINLGYHAYEVDNPNISFEEWTERVNGN